MRALSASAVLVTVVCIGVAVPSAPAGNSAMSGQGGRPLREFLTPDGRFDLEKAKASQYEGPISLEGFTSSQVSVTGELLFTPHDSDAASSDPDDVYWQGGFGLPGLDGTVFALTVFNSQVIAGGDFTTAGGTAANYIAAWNGSSWSALGVGMNSTVNALTVFNSKLIAGGDFTTAGGMVANRIASWDGSSWSALGSGMNRSISALTVFNSQLIAGGEFTIASWDGSSWSALGAGMNGNVNALTVFNSQLIAGGDFTTAGGMAVNRIASWDGSSWSALGEAVNSNVNALTVFNSRLIAGGHFTTAGGISANSIASWDGSSWSALGAGVGGVVSPYVSALTVFNSQLIAGGHFAVSGAMVANRIAAWDGSAWSSLGVGMNSSVLTVAVFNSQLIAGGYFTNTGTIVANYIAAWDGFSWSALGAGMNNFIRSLTIFNSQLIVGGEFTTAGGIAANRIAAWDGSTWSALGAGLDGSVRALTVFNSQLVAGGEFTTAGGMAANRIATWDGSTWSPLGTGLGGGTFPRVYALTVHNSQLIAGGNFTTAGGMAANRIASWDGSSWSPLGAGMNSNVYALTVFSSQLIAGGGFTTAGGTSANHIALWDGFSWSALGAGMNNFIRSLTVFNSQLIAGGEFTSAGGTTANYIAAWDGSSWSALGEGMNSSVNALTVFNSQLIAGGDFTTAGGMAANFIASWDGTVWSVLGSGMNHRVSTLTVYNSQLFAGGEFTTAGGKAAAYISEWSPEPWPSDAISNGGFEMTSGPQSAPPWTLDAYLPGFYVGDFPNQQHSGLYSAYCGADQAGNPIDNALGELSQVLDIPAGATRLTVSFWLWISTDETAGTPIDVLTLWLGNDAYAGFSNVDFSDGYILITIASIPTDAYQGSTVPLRFLATSNGSNPTVFRIDDVRAMYTAPAVNMSISRVSIDFEEIDVGNYAEETFSISNHASSQAALSGYIGPLSSPYSIQDGDGFFSLAPGDPARQVVIRFTPTVSGDADGSLTITHNATNHDDPAGISLLGTGKPPSPNLCGGNALQFDGSSDEVVIPDDPILDFSPSDALTVELWVKYDGAPGALAHILGKRDGGINYQFAQDPSGLFFGANSLFLSGYKLPIGQWTHLAGTHNNGVFELYINGVLASAATTIAPLGNPNDAPLKIGRSGAFGGFVGEIDEVRIWNVARSATEIMANFDRTVDYYSPGLVDYLRFDEVTESQYVDNYSNFAGSGTLGATATAGADDPLRMPSTAPITNCGARPAPPELLAVIDAGTGSDLVVKWRQPNTTNVYEYWVLTATSLGHWQVEDFVREDGSPEYSCRISDLDERTPYFVSVRAREEGLGEFSSDAVWPAAVRPTVPVVLVHGVWIGSPYTWDPPGDAEGYVDWLHQAGFNRVWNIAIPPCGTESESFFLESARALALGINAEILALQAEVGPQISISIDSVDMIAHSMGGLVARRLVATPGDFGFAFPTTVRNLIMLGTPNKGTYLASWVKTEWPLVCNSPSHPYICIASGANRLARDGVNQLCDAFARLCRSCIEQFNELCRDAEPSQTRFSVVAGTRCTIQIGGTCLSDGVVLISSALANDVPIDHRYRRDLGHFALPTDKAVYSQIVGPILLGFPPSDDVSIAAQSIDSTGLQLLGGRIFIGDSGVWLEDTIVIPASEAVDFIGIAERSELEMQLVDPTGLVVDSSLAASDTTAYAYSNLRGATYLTVFQPVQGTWHLRVRTSAWEDTLAPVMAFVQSQGNAILTFYNFNPVGEISDTVILRARLESDDTPLLGAEVTLFGLEDGDTTTWTIPMLDDGQGVDSLMQDGIYSCAFPAAMSSGNYVFRCEASAITPASDSVRLFSVMETYVTGTGRGDMNADGTYDVLDVVGLVSHVFRNGAPPYPDFIADVNCDDLIDVLDVVSLINHVFRNGPQPDCL